MKQVVPSVIITFPEFFEGSPRNNCQNLQWWREREVNTIASLSWRPKSAKKDLKKCYFSADFMPFNRQHHLLSMRTRQGNLVWWGGGANRKLESHHILLIIVRRVVNKQ